jgi:hypothetical protein
MFGGIVMAIFCTAASYASMRQVYLIAVFSNHTSEELPCQMLGLHP